MVSNQIINFSIEENNIDQDRIINGNSIPDEYFCPICRYLLWKPRSCASCRYLFCEKCIQTWLESANNNNNRCPYCCQIFENQQCLRSFEEFLSSINIRCKNYLFGCQKIVLYDELEYHENIECEYLSKQCSECGKLVLISELNRHPGLCIPRSIQCTICQNYFEKSLFREHFDECCQESINVLNIRTITSRNLQRILNNEPPIPLNDGLASLETATNIMQLYEQQKQMSRLPTNLKVVDEVRQVREQNRNFIFHILIMLKFILSNWSRIPFFIFTLGFNGLIAIGCLLLGSYIILSHWVYTHIGYGSVFIVILTYFLSYGTSIAFQFFSDTTIILCFGSFILLYGCLSRMTLEVFEMNVHFKRTIFNIIRCFISIFLMKIILLLIRLYFWSMPITQAAGLITLLNFYLAFKVYHLTENTIPTGTTMDQLKMPM